MKPNQIDERVLVLRETVSELGSRSLLKERLSDSDSVEYELSERRPEDGRD
jgi:hypothetical protein